MRRNAQLTIIWPILFAALCSLQADEPLRVEQNQARNTIRVFRIGDPEPVLTQHARPDFRPYIHPIVAPDGQGVLTEYSPAHHKHQTGLYWGLTRVNGRDYFHHPEGDYWQRVSADVLQAEGTIDHPAVQWRTVYDLLDATGQPLLRETQTWTMRESDGGFQLDLVWQAQAVANVTIGKYDYGGLFLRMPWRKGMEGQVLTSARHRDTRGEGKRAVWLDVGLKVSDREDQAHLAIFDHPRNPGFPLAWRVDNQLGVGPAPTRHADMRLAQGETVQFQHRIYIYTGELNDVRLTERWSRYSGQGIPSAQWGLAQQEGRAAKLLSPAAAVEAMTLPDGFRANVFAAEPMITQPMAFCWDNRGRMWIAENRDYESRGRGFSNSGDSRILILEDTNRNGVADARHVFLEGIPFPAAIAVGFGGLWLGAPPNLLFVPDRDGDDRADIEQIEVRLTGWGIRDRHETLNSLLWGPDGWLYGCQGFATPSKVGKPAGAGKIYRHQEPFPEQIAWEGQPIDINGGVWRYHPTKDRFEVVAHGFSNPWGLDYDSKGQLFISACVIPHLWHVIPGGIYHRQGGSHFNPYVYRDIRTIADHRHRSAHGGARVYQSDAFPDEYQGRIFMANIHEHAVLSDILEPQGSGYVGKHGDDFLLANNAQWIGFSMEIGPEGGLYVLDWHDADICGKEVLNKDTGRVFRMMPEQSRASDWPGRYANLDELSDAALVQLQLSKSNWHARRARLVLQARSAKGPLDPTTHAELARMLATQDHADYRLRALWALHATRGIDSDELIQLLHDDDPHIRAWSVQLLCEDRSPPARAAQQFILMAEHDPSPVVRLYLAAAMQRIPAELAWRIAEQLVQHAADATDHNLPNMIWFAFEPLVVQDPDRALQLAANANIPVITRYVARRLADANQLESVVASLNVKEPAHHQLLLGLRDGLEGRRDLQPPPSWPEVYGQLQTSSGSTPRVALQLAQQFGDTEATAELLQSLSDAAADTESRLQALRALAAQQNPQLPPALPQLLNEQPLRRDVIRAAAAFDDPQIGQAMLQGYPAFSLDDRLEVVHTMAARSGYGRQLTDAIADQRVPRRDIPAYTARTLRRVVGNRFLDVWGTLDPLSADRAAAFAKYRQLLKPATLATADAGRGRTIFNRTCAACHQLYGEGGVIGPDITGANRSNLEYLLGNILAPSEVIQDAYKMHLILTDDGRIYSGIPAGENERQLRLRVANREEPLVIAKSQIESREIAPVSMMPDGLLQELTDQEVLDLVSYLQTRAQVPLPRE